MKLDPLKYVEVDRRHLNQNGLYSFDNYTNAGRKQMVSGSHLAQSLVIAQPSAKCFMTGMESRYGEMVYDVRMPERGTILKLIPRYRVTDDATSIIAHEALNPETIVIYESDQGEIGMFSLPGSFSGHSYFGWHYKATEHLSLLYADSRIDEGVVFLTSPNVQPNGDYQYGITFNTAIMSHPSTIEDGFGICEDVLPKMATTLLKKREVEWGVDEFPVNLYGTEDRYQPFPNIGEYVNEDDILIGFRRNDLYSGWVDQSKRRLREVNPFRDRCIYSGGGGLMRGRVVDIKIYHDEYQPSTLPVEMDSQVERYHAESNRFYGDVCRAIDELERLHGKGNLRLQPALINLHTLAIGMLDKHATTSQERRRLITHDNPMDVWRAEFVIEHTVIPNLGFKLSNGSAAKGVITKIFKREEMPVDQDGNSADIMIAPHAPLNRIIPSLPMEVYFGGTSVKVTQTVRAMLDIGDNDPNYSRKLRQLHETQPERFQAAWAYWLEYTRIMSPNYHYKILTGQEATLPNGQHLEANRWQNLGGTPLTYFIEGLRQPILSLFLPPENDRNYTWAIQEQIEQRPEYRPCIGPVTYVDYNGERVETDEDVQIGPVHYFLLEKITDDGSAVASSKTQIHGFPAQVTNRDKYNNPLKMNPTRVVSETDMRNILSYAGQEAAVELTDRNNSVLTRRQIQETIIGAEHPSAIREVIDRTTQPYGGSKPLQIIKNIGLCMGIEYTYTPYVDDAVQELPRLIDEPQPNYGAKPY